MLTKDNIVLRPFEERDITTFYDWINREESMGNYAGFSSQSYKEIEQKYHAAYFWNDVRKYFIIEVDGIPIGEVVIHNALNYSTAGLELAICIDEHKYRDDGNGKKIITMLVDYIFNNNPDINRIQAVIDTENEPSANLFKSCQFTCEGTLRGISFHHGEFRDSHIYSILRNEWMSHYIKGD